MFVLYTNRKRTRVCGGDNRKIDKIPQAFYLSIFVVICYRSIITSNLFQKFTSEAFDMLDKQDIVLLQDMMDTTVSRSIKVALVENNRVFKRELKMEWRSDFSDMLSRNNVDLKRDIRDEVHSLIAAAEKRIIYGITEFINHSILPQIDDLQTDMIIVKNHLKLA